MNYNKQVCNMLGVDMGEKFYVKNAHTNEIWKHQYFFNHNLELCEEGSNFEITTFPMRTLIKFLIGIYEIIPITQWGKEEKVIAKYAKIRGLKYITKDDDSDELYGFTEKPTPIKKNGSWNGCGTYIILSDKMPHITSHKLYTVDEIIGND